jgi:predicted phage terminase large subunit-like protein
MADHSAASSRTFVIIATVGTLGIMPAAAKAKPEPRSFAPIAPPCPTCDGRLEYRRSHWVCVECAQPVIRPQPGPQETASASAADIVIFGGAAGGGKTWELVFEAARHVRTPGYGAIIFRRTTKQIVGAGSIWEETEHLYPILGGVSREHRLDWKFATSDPDAPAVIQFTHLEHEKNKLDHQGKQYAFIGFDELTHFTESQFWYLQTRARTTAPVRPRVWGTCNPDSDSWVRGFIEWWISDVGTPDPKRAGKIRYFLRVDNDLVWGNSVEEVLEKTSGFNADDVRSLTFIPSKLEDNKILTTADPSYRAILLSMPKIERERLLGANWNIRAEAGDFFQAAYFEIVDEAPKKVRERVRAWDFAATKPTDKNPDPDWTIGVKVSIDLDGVLYVEHVVAMREGPLRVERTLVNTASSDGRSVKVALWQDPGQAGKQQIAHLRRKLLGYVTIIERASKDKQTYAMPVSASAEAGNIKIVRGPWNARFIASLEAFPPEKSKGHDDDADALSLAHLKLARSNLERFRRLAQWKN